MTKERWVYLALDKKRKRVKIGSSSNPKKRVASLSGGAGCRLEIIGTVPGGFDRERECHHRFGDHHIHGEWFRDAPEPGDLGD